MDHKEPVHLSDRGPATDISKHGDAVGSTEEYPGDERLMYYVMDPESWVIARFDDGYSFRNLIEYIWSTNTRGNFRFSKDHIIYEQADRDRTILNRVKIKGWELTKYECHTKDKEIVVGINVSNLKCIGKSIGKKDGVVLFKRRYDQQLYIQIGNRQQDAGNINFIASEPITLEQYEDLPEISRGKRSPNCTVMMSEFTRMCTVMSTLKCKHVKATGYDQVIVFEGITANGIVGRIQRLGDQGSINPMAWSDRSFSSDDTYATGPGPAMILEEASHENEIRIKTETIKSLSKLNNLCANGNIKIYMESGHLKLVCKIGCYGILEIHLLNYN